MQLYTIELNAAQIAVLRYALRTHPKLAASESCVYGLRLPSGEHVTPYGNNPSEATPAAVRAAELFEMLGDVQTDAINGFTL